MRADEEDLLVEIDTVMYTKLGFCFRQWSQQRLNRVSNSVLAGVPRQSMHRGSVAWRDHRLRSLRLSAVQTPRPPRPPRKCSIVGWVLGTMRSNESRSRI